MKCAFVAHQIAQPRTMVPVKQGWADSLASPKSIARLSASPQQWQHVQAQAQSSAKELQKTGEERRATLAATIADTGRWLKDSLSGATSAAVENADEGANEEAGRGLTPLNPQGSSFF